jgi:phospholipase C
MKAEAAAVAFLAALAGADATALGNIKHVIVLMLENRSFDHMLGFLKKLNPDIRGCLPGAEGCSNPMDPTVQDSPSVTVDDSAVYVQVDPHHSISWTTEQIYGYTKGTTPPEGAAALMNGFIKAYSDDFQEDPDAGAGIMSCFAPEHVPIMSTLATEFAVFDGWYASVPGPTMVNRAYAGSATSNGMGTNDDKTIAKGMPQKTMFKQLLDMGLDYRVYYQDVPTVLQFKDMRHKEARQKYAKYDQFFADVQSGEPFPEFTWIEPAYFSTMNQPATDQHPDHDVGLGEQVVKDIYEALRASPIWNETMFMITYDEHGGFFDHVSPPENVPNPDGKNAIDDPFDFTRLGIRIPTVVASPWITKGTVVHAPEDPEEGASQYDHTSVISTVVHKLFKAAEGYPAPEYLTERDAWSLTFESLFETESSPRTDCPAELPAVYSQSQYAPAQDGSLPLSDLQKELTQLTAHATGDSETLLSVDLDTWSEGTAAAYIEYRMEQFFQN